jgi:hypothetical protein
MKAFRKDLESRAISADATSYHERKAEAGALGLSSGPLQQTAAVDWSRIVETVNARLGPDAQ